MTNNISPSWIKSKGGKLLIEMYYSCTTQENNQREEKLDWRTLSISTLLLYTFGIAVCLTFSTWDDQRRWEQKHAEETSQS